jgi:hypothetical protein
MADSHVTQISALYEILPESSRIHLREGIERLFRQAEPNDFSIDALGDLIDLTGLTRSFSAMRAFVPVLGSGPWSEIGDDLHSPLIYKALAALLMHERSREAGDAARGLLTSSCFIDEHVVTAYIILLRCTPELWARDLALVRGRLSRLRGKYAAFPELNARLLARERDIAEALHTDVAVSQLAADLHHLVVSRRDESDARLIDPLFAGPDPLFELTSDTTADSFWLIDARSPERRAYVQNTTAVIKLYLELEWQKDFQYPIKRPSPPEHLILAIDRTHAIELPVAG